MSKNSFYGPLDDPAGNAGYHEHPPRVGFFTDTSVCIGCKACEVACKEWNEVPDDGYNLLGMSFDNTGNLGADSWRHVAFIEQPGREPVDLGMPGVSRPGDATGAETRQDFRWLIGSHVCKHCTHAGCLDVCPTGALFRTEFGTVVVLPGAKIRGRRQQPRQGHHISSSSAGMDGQSRSTRRTRASSGSPATLYPHKGRDVAAMRWSSDSTHSARISTNLDHRMTRCTSCSAAPPS